MRILGTLSIESRHLILEMEVLEIVQIICRLDAIVWVLSKYVKSATYVT